MRNDVSVATEVFAQYLNVPRDRFDDEQRELLDEDTERARAAMERAWLEMTLVRE